MLVGICILWPKISDCKLHEMFSPRFRVVFVLNNLSPEGFYMVPDGK